ncbi:MAG: hypothetical protein R3B09_13180 [Nannocystaceae bacterium]
MSETFKSPGGRYDGLPILEHQVGEGPARPYVARRLIPPPDDAAVIAEHAVVAGDRLDHLADRYLGDPELAWRLCDANAALSPAELTAKIGRRIKIALPDGLGGGDGGGDAR